MMLPIYYNTQRPNSIYTKIVTNDKIENCLWMHSCSFSKNRLHLKVIQEEQYSFNAAVSHMFGNAIFITSITANKKSSMLRLNVQLNAFFASAAWYKTIIHHMMRRYVFKSVFTHCTNVSEMRKNHRKIFCIENDLLR